MDGESHALGKRQHPEVVDEDAGALVQSLDRVEDGDDIALGVRLNLRYAHPAILYQELGSRVRNRLLVELQDLRVLPEVLVAVDIDPSPFKKSMFGSPTHLQRLIICGNARCELLLELSRP